MSDEIMVKDVRGDEVPLAEDYGFQAQQAAEEHLNNCIAYMRAEEFEDLEETDLGESPAIGAYDGCTTCDVREVLYASLPFIIAGLKRDGETVPEARVHLYDCPFKDMLNDDQAQEAPDA